MLKADGYHVDIVAETRFPIWGSGGIDEWKGAATKPRLTPEQESKRTCVILHSSGSVSLWIRRSSEALVSETD